MAKKENSALTLLLIILLACAALAVAYAFLPKSKAGQPSDGSGGISLELSSRPFVDGNIAQLIAASSCGAFSLSLDGQAMGASERHLEVQIPLTQGSHTLLAQGSSGCQASLGFTVLARECIGNQSSSCAIGDCTGKRSCSNGIYTVCELPKRICVPGEKMGCSTDGCKFGYAACNSCGTGFGACMPPSLESGENSSASCLNNPSCK